MNTHELGLCCGRRAELAALGAGGREAFVLPGTPTRYVPDRQVDVRHVRLEVELDPAVHGIRGDVHHRVAALVATDTVLLHADELTIEAVRDGRDEPLGWRLEGDRLEVRLGRVLVPGAEAEVRVRYRGTPRRGLYFMAPDASNPERRHEIWSQGQDEDSRAWFPCFDHPSEKASTEIIAVVPAGYETLGNGALLEKRPLDDGRVRWHWRQALPHSAYLVMLVVGRYDVLDLGGDGLPLSAYVPEGRAEDGRRAFARTAEMVACFNERFGVTYPYEKYAQIVVQDFIFGGMENTTATTLVDTVLYDERAALDVDMDDLIAHELAHQWWGDLLTCRDWAHAWLNEGFATYSEVLWMEQRLGADEADHKRLQQLRAYLAEDGGQHRRAIVERRWQEPIDLFDRHLYEKGGLVLAQMRHELGEDAFWRGLRTYAGEHRGRTVVTEDLRRSIERATGRDMEALFDQYVFHAGHPELEVEVAWEREIGRLKIVLKQTQKGDEQTAEAFRFTLDVEVRSEDGARHTHRLEVTDRETRAFLACTSAPTQVDLDPRGMLLATWSITMDDGWWRTSLGSDAPCRARVRAIEALAKKPSHDNVAALAAALGDGFWGVGSEAAKALGGIRRDDARDALCAADAPGTHPKVRRAVVRALGAWRGDAVATEAVRQVLVHGDPSVLVEAEAARSWGRLRAAGAQALLEDVLRTRDSWGEVIRGGALDGLAELGTPEALPPLVAAAALGQPVRVRTAALKALGRLATGLVHREAAFDALAQALPEPDLRVVSAAIAGLTALGDERAIGLLAGAPRHHPDGRAQRMVRIAQRDIAKHGTRTTELARLAETVDKMQQEQAKLLERLERLAARLDKAAGAS